MPKKKEIKKIFENLELESSEAHADLTESPKTRQEPPAQNLEPVGEEETKAGAEAAPTEQSDPETPESAGAGQDVPVPDLDQARQEEPTADTEASPTQQSDQETGETFPDDLLEDVRKSLIDDEAHEQEEKPRWWQRIGRSSRKKTSETETPEVVEEINLPALNAMQTADVEAEVEEDKESEEYLEQIDELIDLLDTEDEAVEEAPVRPVEEVPAEPEKTIDIEELKKQAFQPRHKEGEAENLTEVRSIALEGDEEVFVEVESKPADPLEERLSAVENALKPYRRYINFAFAFLGLVMAITAAFLIYNAYQRSLPQEPVVEEVSNLPFPTSVSLPGGWSFSLGRGVLVDGNWNPAGAEWLQGTEVCRWVALPYSRQLEAVIRTLNPDDPIELGMSNNDTLIYNVYSIRQMSPQEMQELDSNSPCLLIVLAEPGAEQRWVLTALP